MCIIGLDNFMSHNNPLADPALAAAGLGTSRKRVGIDNPQISAATLADQAIGGRSR